MMISRMRGAASRTYLPLYVAEFQFRYNNFNPDIFGRAIASC